MYKWNNFKSIRAATLACIALLSYLKSEAIVFLLLKHQYRVNDFCTEKSSQDIASLHFVTIDYFHCHIEL